MTKATLKETIRSKASAIAGKIADRKQTDEDPMLKIVSELVSSGAKADTFTEAELSDFLSRVDLFYAGFVTASGDRTDDTPAPGTGYKTCVFQCWEDVKKCAKEECGGCDGLDFFKICCHNCRVNWALCIADCLLSGTITVTPKLTRK